MLAWKDDKSISEPKLCMIVGRRSACVSQEAKLNECSTLTGSVVLLWCKKGLYLAEGEAIMALLWIMRPSVTLISR